MTISDSENPNMLEALKSHITNQLNQILTNGEEVTFHETQSHCYIHINSTDKSIADYVISMEITETQLTLLNEGQIIHLEDPDSINQLDTYLKTAARKAKYFLSLKVPKYMGLNSIKKRK